MNSKNRSIIYIVSLIFMIIVNAISILFPLGGQTVSEVTQNYYALFTPAAYAFSIWGLIYLLLLGFVIFQAQPQNRDAEFIQKIGWWFPISCLLNSLWLVVWLNEWITLSVIIIVGLLISILMTYYHLQNEYIPLKGKLFVKLPFSIYAGWVSVATIVNISIYLSSVGFGGFGLSDTFWACIMIVVATFLGIALLLKYQDIAFSLVLVWAFIAIAAQQSDYSAIVITAWMSTIALIVIAILVNIFGKQGGKQGDGSSV
jgi:benzodiazapine receptor